MDRLTSKIRTASPDFRDNAAHHKALADELRATLAAVRRGGSDEARERHTGRGKLLVRDRIDTLLDPGSPFLELGAARGARHARRRGAAAPAW